MRLCRTLLLTATVACLSSTAVTFAHGETASSSPMLVLVAPSSAATASSSPIPVDASSALRLLAHVQGLPLPLSDGDGDVSAIADASATVALLNFQGIDTAVAGNILMTVYGMSASLAFASGSTSIPLEVHDDKTIVAFTVGQSALMEEVQRRHPQARVIEVVSDHGNVDGAPSSSATADALAAYFTSISIEEARRLEEATVLGELVEVARTVEKLTLVGGAEGESPLFLSIVIGAPATIKSRYGSESDEYATVVRAVEELVQKLTALREKSFPSAAMELAFFPDYAYATFLPSASPRASSPQLLAKRDVAATAVSSDGRFTSESDCSTATESCSEHGECKEYTPGRGDKFWMCKCESGYAGLSCQYNDYIATTSIVFWTTLVLVLTLAGTVSMVYAVGEETVTY